MNNYALLTTRYPNYLLIRLIWGMLLRVWILSA